ncbi:MAG: DUF4252 domain-containing protein [Bacteroidales bacterium]|nr:DUF4252 domain-containing protein [Bacteroidales bacterium]
MKRLVIILVVLSFSLPDISAQFSGTQQLYDKYKGEEGVMSLWIPGLAIRLASSIADLEDEEADFLRTIRSLRILTIEEKSLFPDANFTREASIEAGWNGYKMMMEVHDSGEDVCLLGRTRNGKLKDLLILVGGEDNVLVHIKGRMNADMIGSLANIAGVEEHLAFNQE